MEITIRHTKDCPNAVRAEHNVHEAMRAVGKTAAISRELVASIDEAERLAFAGSPTILVDGRDPFVATPTEPALACRIYQTEEGPDGAPSVSQLTAALSD